MKERRLERCGLDVRFSDGVLPRQAKKGDVPTPRGWYIWAESSEGPHALMELRFLRAKDAELAKRALIGAGLDNVRKMKAAGPHTVFQIAIGALQW